MVPFFEYRAIIYNVKKIRTRVTKHQSVFLNDGRPSFQTSSFFQYFPLMSLFSLVFWRCFNFKASAAAFASQGQPGGRVVGRRIGAQLRSRDGWLPDVDPLRKKISEVIVKVSKCQSIFFSAIHSFFGVSLIIHEFQPWKKVYMSHQNCSI